MNTEYETKPLNVKDKLQFEKLAEELLNNWAEYKKLKSRMELLDSTCKKYMVDNDMNIYGNDKGNLMIVEQGRRILDRTLIDDIEKYKVDAKVKMMFKSMRS